MMIQVTNLTKKYGDRLAIQGLNFTVPKGEVLGFLGPNGAGKTTTMKIITGCMAPTSGSVSIDGQDILKHSMSTRSKIGYLPEIPPLYEDMYVRGYLKYVARLKKCHIKQIHTLVDSVIEKVGLKEVQSRLIANLSKGYKQRVGLAQALVADPDVLVLDEPTVGLDPSQVMEIRKLIHHLKKQHTVILSTHILSEVEANCEKVVIINKGRIATAGDLSELKSKMKQRVLNVRVKNPSDSLTSHLKDVQGVSDVRRNGDTYTLSIETEVNDEVAKVAVSSGLLELKTDDFKLEDLFIHATK